MPTELTDVSSETVSESSADVDNSRAIELPDALPEADAPEASDEGKGEKADASEKKEDQTPEQKKEATRSKQLAALMKQEAELRRKNQSLERKQQELEQQYNQKVEQLRGEYERVETFKKNAYDYLARIKQDPIGWLQEEMGFGPEEYYARFMNDGKPTKDEVQSESFKALESKYTALERRLLEKEAAEKEAYEKWLERQEQAKQEAAEKSAQAEAVAAQEEFWQLITKNPSEYDALNYESDGERLYPREVLLKAAMELVQEMGDEAQNLSYTDLAKQMNESAGAWLKKFKGVDAANPAAERKTPAAQVTKRAAEETKTRRSAGLNGEVIKTKTLSADLTASKASAKVGRNWEEEKEALKRELSSSR